MQKQKKNIVLTLGKQYFIYDENTKSIRHFDPHDIWKSPFKVGGMLRENLVIFCEFVWSIFITFSFQFLSCNVIKKIKANSKFF